MARLGNIEPFNVESAVAGFMELKLGPDDVISHETMWSLIGLVQPEDVSPYGWGQAQKLKSVPRIGALEDALLERYTVGIVSVPGLGFRIVRPEEQAPLALKKALNAVRNKLARGIKRATYVDRSALNDQQKAEQADAIAKLTRHKDMLREPRGGF